MIFATAFLVAYTFSPASKLEYDLKVVFEGFIPVLGGQEGKAEVEATFIVQGQSGDEGRQKASHELKQAVIKFNDAPLPLAPENLKSFFPKTVAEFDPNGKVFKTDAPNIAIPVRLPGLDPKRLPELVYLPVEWPSEALELGKPWTFERAYGESKVVTEAVPKAITDTKFEIALKFSQDYKTLEDEAVNVVSDPKDAISEVRTKVEGTGTATFDRVKGVFSKAVLIGTATSEVTDLQDRTKTSTRKLSTRTEVSLKQPNSEPAKATADTWEARARTLLKQGQLMLGQARVWGERAWRKWFESR